MCQECSTRQSEVSPLVRVYLAELSGRLPTIDPETDLTLRVNIFGPSRRYRRYLVERTVRRLQTDISTIAGTSFTAEEAPQRNHALIPALVNSLALINRLQSWLSLELQPSDRLRFTHLTKLMSHALTAVVINTPASWRVLETMIDTPSEAVS